MMGHGRRVMGNMLGDRLGDGLGDGLSHEMYSTLHFAPFDTIYALGSMQEPYDHVLCGELGPTGNNLDY